MSGSVNKVILIGNLGADPEIRFTTGGQPVAHFSLATSEKWTAKSGEKSERTDWHRIVAWGKLAELCGDYLKKGRSVYLEGRIQYRQWEDKKGEKRYTTEITANQIVFLGGADGGKGQGAAGDQANLPGTGEGAPAGTAPEMPPAMDDEDVPF